ncbi:hypothetical protein [Candidatus Foliamicus sp.]
MTSMPTDKAIEEALSVAARERVVQTFSRLRKHWANDRWLGEQNYCRRDTSERIRSAEGTFKDSQLTDYIGASTIGHCFDGWSFLGRAIEAELAGDPGSARHLGYYAELRAAMSLLACEGIGIFDRHHAVVRSNGSCEGFGKGKPTHEVVWDVLNAWSRTNESAERLMGIIRPDGIPLAQWIGQFGGSAQFITHSWLEQWGLDLERLKSDRKARNQASYRPAIVSGSPPADVEQTIFAVDELWTLCDPGGSGGFPVMDRHLLRRVLVLLFELKGDGLKPPDNMGKFKRRVERMLNAMDTAATWKEFQKFLTFEMSRVPSSLLVDANGRVQADHKSHSRQVLARATLLLRLATGSVSDLLKASGSDFERELKFWWNGDAVRRRLWSLGAAPESFLELWSDVETALRVAEEWRRSPDKEASHWGFWTATGETGWMLSSSERAFLWGMT